MLDNDRPAGVPRRRFLQAAGLTLVGVPWIHGQPAPAAKPSPEYRPLNRFPRMVHEYFVAQVRRIEEESLRRKAGLMTKADAQAYVARVREQIRDCFGPEPERTPLNARTTGTLERDGYVIEKVIFESRPRFPVTANLYLPRGVPFPVPAVVGTCGHATEGKAYGEYQAFAQGLARLGYVCLLFDPIGQGERAQLLKEDLTHKTTAVAQHTHIGCPQFLVGEFLGAWMAWDGSRAIDYLLTRSEVDPRHIGVTGNSGGGTQTTWICATDRRVTMAAPSCFITTFRRNLENELPADPEQCPPRSLARGLDEDDFLAAMAPHPVIVLAKERDFFDVRGVREVHARLERLYRLLGAAKSAGLFVGVGEHGFSRDNREAMYRWFDLVTGRSTEPRPEPAFTIEKEETLRCTPRGQVAGLDGTLTVMDMTRAASGRLSQARGAVAGPKLRAAVRDILVLPDPPSSPPEFRIWPQFSSRQYPTPHAAAYAVETEPGILVSVYLLTQERLQAPPPRSETGRAVLYVAHQSSDAELRTEPLIREVMQAEPESALFACDVRGIGESQPGTTIPNAFLGRIGSDYFYAIHSVMLGRPYLGQRTWDVLRVLDWLAEYGYREIHLVGRGWGAFPATFAALLSDRVTQATLKNALVSYAALAEADDYTWPLAVMPPNVLARFDLPDCYRELAAKQLRQIEPLGPRGERL